MKKICLFIILIINFLTIEKLSSQNVVINGKVNEPNALIRLFSYNDMLSCEVTKIAETKSDHEGVFKLEATINEIGIAQIAVNLERVDFLLKPNATYDLEILIPEQEIESSYFERQNPTLKMNNADDQGLYYQYYASETIINDFILEHFNQIYRGISVSDIRGIFHKDTFEWLNWISQGKALYLDKKKIQILIDQQRTNLADVEYLDLNLIESIIKAFINPL